METNEVADGEDRIGVPTYVIDAVVALLVMGLGLTVLQGSWKLGSGWTTDGPGPGYFPFYIGLILCVSAAGIVGQGLRKRDTEIFVNRQQLKQVLVVLIPAAFYVLAVQLLGLYVASAVYIAAFMYWL